MIDNNNKYEIETLWSRCCRMIKDNLTDDAFNAWFKPIQAVSFDGVYLTLSVPSQFFIERIEDTYFNLFSASVRGVFGPQAKVKYSFDVVKNDPDTQVTLAPAPKSSAVMNRVEQQAPDELDSNLNPKYTFESYCASSSNQLALSIATAIATQPSLKTFNPLLIFGATGVGKTHLIQAIGIKMKETSPRLRVLYLTARVFETQYTTAIKQNKFNDFMAFYQSIDVLIIDDIQEFAGKEGTQNTFYHIFNHLHQNQKQIIMSCDCPPVSLDGIVPRLMSRFKWGVTAELQQPDYTLRRKFLLQKAEEDGLTISADVIEYIAQNVTESVRELEGIVLSLITRATFLGQPLSVDMAKAVVANAVDVARRPMSFEFITETVGQYYGLDSDLIYGKSRKREISDARQVVMTLAKKYTKLSSTAIGAKLSRDHATVLHACKQIEQRCSVDRQLQADIEAIEAQLKH